MGHKHSRSRPASPYQDAPPPYATSTDQQGFELPDADAKSTLDVRPDAMLGPSASRGLAATEDALELLRKYDVVVLMDDSGSMNDGKRWKEACKALSAVAQKAGEYDADGIDIAFMNNTITARRLRDESSVKRLFNSIRPAGLTPIGERLEELMHPYLDRIEAAKAAGPEALKRIKPVNYIVITDGVPSDDPEAVIVAAARRLDANNFPLSQLGIQFVQVGDEQSATKFLRNMDDALQHIHKIRDIVDTTASSELRGTLSGEGLIKALLGGINRRVDKKGGGSVLQ